ncbi:MinD/ParA family ATP-binding protein [Nocardiopsis ansamitocini]|uniref:CobQ/CobB/MinD/ParA nucleotide binding domain-containing protein n=1 Tax=Nocardiopsis ansamitocini TaxID=1670832 RepID=A0A9W6PA65_9ACTN|nr:AAA family ATPase [Nocardiopsis ansamitocini]GLU49854.1 hypothetical protein Nans01_42050 [Nocardiopsis ansamitocini]
MAYREHDGSEHAGARPLRREYDDAPEAGTAREEGTEPAEGQQPSPADQWFGDGFDSGPIAPPPPYAQPNSDRSGAFPPPPPARPPSESQSQPNVAPPAPTGDPVPLPPPPLQPPRQEHPAPEQRPRPPAPAEKPFPLEQPPDVIPLPPNGRGASSAVDESDGGGHARNQARPAPEPWSDELPEPEPLPPLDAQPYRLPKAGSPRTSTSPGQQPPVTDWSATPPPPPAPPQRVEQQDGPKPPVQHVESAGPPRQAPQKPEPVQEAPRVPPSDRDGVLSPPGPEQRPQTGPGRSPTGPGRGTDHAPVEQPGFDPRPRLPETAEALKADTLVRGRRQPPSAGWRKALHSATFGLVHPGESPAELRRRELMARARTHVAGGHHRVAVLSLKGGVGKTTTSVALGSTLASLRGDRVLAVDANPDRGTLSDKLRLETAATIRDLLNEKELIQRYADIRGFTSQASSRLEVLASDRDPAVSEAFSEADYREVCRLLEHFYSITLTDCGTGLLHSAMKGVLGLADQIVLVSTPSVDGARSASATLDWLEAHEFGYLVRGAVVVLSMVRTGGKSSVDLQRLEDHFGSRCRAVVQVPWDSHLEEGAEVDLDQLAPATRHAYLELAATVGEAFAWPR